MTPDRTEDQYGFWDEAERASAAAAELNAAIMRVTQDRAAATATAVCQVASAGFAPDQTRRQIEDILNDEFINLMREVVVCRA